MLRSLDPILRPLAALLSFPPALLRVLLERIIWEASLFQGIVRSGQGINWGRLLSLGRLSLFFAFILGLAAFLVFDSVRRVMFTEEKERGFRTVIFDVAAVLIILFLYYFVAALALYLLFKVAIPIQKSL